MDEIYKALGRRDIIEYRAHMRDDWHDAAWWDYHWSETCAAIGYAERNSDSRDYADIAAAAMDYIRATADQI